LGIAAMIKDVDKSVGLKVVLVALGCSAFAWWKFLT
jgi:hypothetical protein